MDLFGPIHPEIIRCSRCCNPWSPDGHACGDIPLGYLPGFRWINWPFMSECPRNEAKYQAGLALHRQRQYEKKIADAWEVFLREVGLALIFYAGVKRGWADCRAMMREDD